jgi:hypothetical protein
MRHGRTHRQTDGRQTDTDRTSKTERYEIMGDANRKVVCSVPYPTVVSTNREDILYCRQAGKKGDGQRGGGMVECIDMTDMTNGESERARYKERWGEREREKERNEKDDIPEKMDWSDMQIRRY